MGKFKIEEVFLRDRLSKTLKDIAELNTAKIAEDITDILNYKDVDDIFSNPNRHRDINEALASKQFELRLLIYCVKNGIDKLRPMVDNMQADLEEKDYKELSDLVDEIIALCKHEVNEETGVVA